MNESVTQEKGFDMRPMIAILMLLVAVAFIGAVTPQPQPSLYGCPYCDESFDTLEELIAHVATAHPDETPIEEIDIEWD